MIEETGALPDVISDIEGKSERKYSCKVAKITTNGFEWHIVDETIWKTNCGAVGIKRECAICGWYDSTQIIAGCWQHEHNKTYDWQDPYDPHHKEDM